MSKRRDFWDAIRRGDSSGALRAAKGAGCGVLVIGGQFVLQRLEAEMDFNEERVSEEKNNGFEYARGVARSGALGKTTTGQAFVVVTYEILSDGDRNTQRYDYRGYINSKENAERTIQALRISGWKGKRWSEINGAKAWDAKPVALALSREWTMNGDRQYLRVAFVNVIRKASAKTPLNAVEATDLDAEYADLLAMPGEGESADEEPSGGHHAASYDEETGEVHA